MATLAGAVIVSVADTSANVQVDLVDVDLTAVRDAVRQFRRDTGYLPKTGPFALEADGGAILDPVSPVSLGFSSAEAWREWFRSPANLSQLIQRPDLSSDFDHLETWDFQSKRGWNGPYLSGRLGSVVVGDGLDSNGTGDPATGLQLDMPVYSLSDGYPAAEIPDTPLLIGWTEHAYSWLEPGQNTPSYRRSPILLLNLDDPSYARVVSIGEDGLYTSYNPDPDPADPQGPLDPTLGPAMTGSDDLGLFLLR